MATGGKVKLCDICGSFGNREQIVTCSKCRKASEHLYCMQHQLFAIPESWYCEACQASRKQTQPPVKKACPKTVESGKVKFLSSEEVALLTSGAKTKLSVGQESLGVSDRGRVHLPFESPKVLKVMPGKTAPFHCSADGRFAPKLKPERSALGLSINGAMERKVVIPIPTTKTNNCDPKKELLISRASNSSKNLSLLDRNKDLPSNKHVHRPDLKYEACPATERRMKTSNVTKLPSESTCCPPAFHLSTTARPEVAYTTSQCLAVNSGISSKVISVCADNSKRTPQMAKHLAESKKNLGKEILHLEPSSTCHYSTDLRLESKQSVSSNIAVKPEVMPLHDNDSMEALILQRLPAKRKENLGKKNLHEEPSSTCHFSTDLKLEYKQTLPSLVAVKSEVMPLHDNDSMETLIPQKQPVPSGELFILPSSDNGMIEEPLRTNLPDLETGKTCRDYSEKPLQTNLAGFCNDFAATIFHSQENSLPLTLLITKSPGKSDIPNPEVQWRGRFKILDIDSHVLVGIQAHFPGKVTSKAYEATKSLPELLKVKLVERIKVWPRIFRLDSPDCDDIALYFLPSESDRSSEKYINLLDRINSHDLGMLSCLDGMELLIFSSKQLPSNSQRLNGHMYLWGVYRPLKCKKVFQQAQEILATPDPSRNSSKSLVLSPLEESLYDPLKPTSECISMQNYTDRYVNAKHISSPVNFQDTRIVGSSSNEFESINYNSSSKSSPYQSKNVLVSPGNCTKRHDIAVKALKRPCFSESPPGFPKRMK